MIFGLNGNDVIDGGPSRQHPRRARWRGRHRRSPEFRHHVRWTRERRESVGAGGGSEAFIGGAGRDAIIFGNTDRGEEGGGDGGSTAHFTVWCSGVPSRDTDRQRQWLVEFFAK